MLKKILSFAAALVVAVSAVLVPASAKAPEYRNRYVTTVYNEQNGLPTGEANAVLQTNDGYIWIGSYGGLIRYDGTTFKNYSTTGELESSSVRALFEDSKGRLWIGTNDAGVFVFENDSFRKIPCSLGNTFLCIRDFAEGPDGKIYVASTSGIGEIEGDSLIPYTDEELAEKTVYALGVDKYNRVWGVMNAGIVSVVRDRKLVRKIESEEIFKDSEVYCLSATNNGDILLGSSGNRLARLIFSDKDEDNDELKYYSTGKTYTHNRIKETKNGSIIVSGLHGFYVLLPDGGYYEFGEERAASSINCADMDYEGNIWLASNSYGVIKYTIGSYYSPNFEAGLSGITLNAVTESDGMTYIGTDSGIKVFDSSWNPVVNSLTEKLNGVRVRDIIRGDNGLIWAASYSENSLCCYNPKTDSLDVFNPDSGMASDRVRTLLRLSDGSIAAGTQQGLSIIHPDKTITTLTEQDGLVNPAILCILEKDDGTLLAGSDGYGIYEINGTEIINHSFDEGLKEGVVLRMLRDGSLDAYFVSAGSSLYYWADGKFTKLTNLEKEAGSIFDFYLRDNKLWLLQNSGVLCVDRDILLSGERAETVMYGFDYGMTGSLNANTWHYINDEGNLVMATRSGISVFNFSGVDTCLPKLILNSVTVDGKRTEHPDTIMLDSTAQRITIDFAALSFTNTSNFTVAYRLENFDEEETVLNNLRSGDISYTNLPGGSYTFRVRVFDKANPDIQNTVTLTIEKEKNIAERPLFWAGVLLSSMALVAAIGLLIYKAKMAQMKKRQRQLKSLSEEALVCFARTIDAKDKYTNGHSVRVALYSRELAKRMGKSEAEQEHIYYVALLHDIGKIGVPDNILNKPGRLTDEEYEIIKSHPAIGGDILKEFTAIEGIADGARYHHERYDGRGYCEGKKGTEIPEVARIIGVADTYDAMSSSRCYREALSSKVIIDELKKAQGTQLDPEVVPFMLEMIEDGTAPIK